MSESGCFLVINLSDLLWGSLGCTVLTGNTVYGTAGGDVVEHAAPWERSSNTARGSGNPRDKSASTSPSTRGITDQEKKENCDRRDDTPASWMNTWVYRRA